MELLGLACSLNSVHKKTSRVNSEWLGTTCCKLQDIAAQVATQCSRQCTACWAALVWQLVHYLLQAATQCSRQCTACCTVLQLRLQWCGSSAALCGAMCYIPLTNQTHLLYVLWEKHQHKTRIKPICFSLQDFKQKKKRSQLPYYLFIIHISNQTEH